MDLSKIKGIVVPAITPVDAQDCVDDADYRAHLRYLIASGVHGVFVGGTAGEGTLLTLENWERMSSIAYEECCGKVYLLGGAMDTSTSRIKQRIKILSDIGYRHFVVGPTFYQRLSVQAEYLRLFGACKEAAPDMDLIVYNIPSYTGTMVPIEVVREMVQRKWTQCCKDSSEDMEYFGRLMSEAGPLGLRVLCGSEMKAAEALLMGAHGLVPVGGNYEPETYLQAFDARGNAERLGVIQERITSLVRNVLLEPRFWLAGAKSAVARRGIGSGRPVSPFEPLNDEERCRAQLFWEEHKLSGSVTA